MIICQGCGQAFPVPAGYTRNKIQCPGCGVICLVPEDAPRAPADEPRRASPPVSKPREDSPPVETPVSPQAEIEPIPLFDDEPVPTPSAPAAKPSAKRQELNFSCRRCGRRIRRQRECPSCDAMDDTPVDESPIATLAPHALELDPPPIAQALEDEEVSPYLFADRDIPRCPKCLKDMVEGGVVCTACGFNVRTRKKAARTYQPIDRQWETDMSLQQRLIWLGVGQGAHLLMAFIAVQRGYSAFGFLASWPLFMAILCFVLGTYEKIRLVRDAKGRVQLTKQWRFCFLPLRAEVMDVRGFEGVTTGQWHDAGFLEWLVFGSLLFLMIIPALIWWYNAIYRMHFHVALSLDHGYPDVWVYRGRSQEQMNDIADTLVNASGLRRS